MNELLRKRSKLRKGVSIFALVATVFVASGGAALAVAPADFGLTEGDTISANTLAGDPDVYIVNDWGFKRLFLNPVIFGFYGHLGFDKVKQVSAATRDAFVTSGLFRNCEAGDLKVYGVATTGEDTGMLHWVNMTGSAAVAEDANFFNKVFCINNNEFNWYTNNGATFGSDYTALSQVPDYSRGDTGAQVGPVSLSVAPGSPAARTVTLNAQGLELLRVRMTGTGTVTGLTVTRGGAGGNDDFSNVYLYDGNTRLTSARSVNTSTGQVQFVNLGLAVNGTRDISVIVDMNSATADAGNVHYFEVSASSDAGLSGSVTAGGSYPVRSNLISVSGASSGTLTVDTNGSISNPSVGQQNAQISEFKLTTATEAGLVKRIRFLQNGTVVSSGITNIVVKDLAGTQVGTGAMTADGYMDVTFSGNGYTIAKGDFKVFQVFANVAGKKAETIDLYVEITADALAVGDQYGFGMAVTENTAASDHLLTLRGGDLTLTFAGPTATNVGTDTQDSHLLDFTLSGAAGIELKSHTLLICADIAGDGTFDALDANFADLEDIKIVNVDTGVTLVGPANGSAFITASASAGECGGVAGLYKTFTDQFDVLAGQTLNLAITADVQQANTADSSGQLVDGSIVKIILESYADAVGTSGNLAIAKYIGTNTAVGSAQIVPSGDLTSNNVTISTTGLTLGLAGSPVSKTVVKGTQGVEVLGATFKASLASDVTVKKVTLTGQSGTDSGTVATANTGSLVNTVTLYDGDTGALIPATVTSSTLSSDGKIQFDNMNWVVPAGATKTLLAKANLSTNSVPTIDVFAFDIAAAADVTALDNSGQSITATGNDFNIATNTSTVDVTVTSAGTLTVAAAPSTPSTKALHWGQTGEEVGQFRFTSANEGFLLEKLTFGVGVSGSSGTEKTDLAANAKDLTLQYTNKAGATVTVTQAFTGGASANFGFTGANRPYIPKDSSMDIVLKLAMKTKAEGATTSAGTTNRFFSIDYQDTYAGSQTDGVRAIGEGSGNVLDGSSAGIGKEVAGNNHYVYRVFPKFDQVAISATEPLGTQDVLKFTITAMGLPDSKLFFDNTAAGSGSIKFEVVASGNLAATTLTPIVYDLDGNIYDSTSTITSAGDIPTNYASYTFNFGEKDLEISGGQSKTLRVEVNFTGFTDQSDYFQLRLLDNEASLINWVDNSTGVSTNADVNSVTGVLKTLPMSGPTFSKI